MNYSKSAPLLLTAAWIWPGHGEAIQDGALLIEADRISAVLDRKSKEDILQARPAGLEVLHCQDSVVTPGLFNLHTHLDYTRVDPIEPGLPLFAWLKELVSRSRRLGSEDFVGAAAAGARLAALAGTTYVVDSSYTGSGLKALAAVGLKGMVALELFGLSEAKAEKLFNFWLERRNQLLSTADGATKEALDSGRLKLTAAPHAPYTVGPALWKLADNWAADQGLMLTAHLSETIDEVRWVGADCDEVDQYLAWVMPPDPERSFEEILRSLNWRRPGLTPVQLLQEHGLLNHRLLAAHCVHVSSTDLAGLAGHGVSAALCRRSNARLLTGCPAVEKFTAIGLFFGLGTDSLASCQDLSPLAEAAAWWQQDQEAGIDANEALSWVTSRAARAVHQSDIGSFKPGMRADIAVFPGPGSQPNQRSSAAARFKAGQAAAYLLDGLPPALHLLVNGEFVIRDGKVLSDS